MKFIKAQEGSTAQLLQFCGAYFITYVFFGIFSKWFPAQGGMPHVSFLIYSSIGGSVVCLSWVILRSWWRAKDVELKALYYVIPSGICTAIVVPTTTMMYLLPISVMVAMVIMRSSLIIIGRAVDEIQIRQGLLTKKVYQEENTAVLFALTAAGMQLFFVKPGDFDFVRNPAAMTILSAYLVAYAIRIYIMNYYKNTRPKGTPLNNNWFFAVEQITTSIGLTAIAILVCSLPMLMNLERPLVDAPAIEASLRAEATAAGVAAPVIDPEEVAKRVKAARGGPVEAIFIFRDSFRVPEVDYLKPPNYGRTRWLATGAGMFFGLGAFFSVFIFMFKGRTATFANLSNRLTSLVAGTVSTVLYALWFGGKMPKMTDWLSLLYIFIAVGYLSLAENRRVAEMTAEKELAAQNVGSERRSS